MITDEFTAASTEEARYIPLSEAAERVAPYRTAIALKKALEQGRIKSLPYHGNGKRRRVWMVDTQSATYRDWVDKAQNLRAQHETMEQNREEVRESKDTIKELNEQISDLQKRNYLLEEELKLSKRTEDSLWIRATDMEARYTALRHAYDQLIQSISEGESLSGARLARRSRPTTVPRSQSRR